MKDYFVTIGDGTQEGPYDEAYLKSRVEAGKYDHDALIWCEGMETWEPITRHFAMPTATPPPVSEDDSDDEPPPLPLNMRKALDEPDDLPPPFAPQKQNDDASRNCISQFIHVIKNARTQNIETFGQCKKLYKKYSPTAKKTVQQASRTGAEIIKQYHERLKKKRRVRIISYSFLFIIGGLAVYFFLNESDPEINLPSISSYSSSVQKLVRNNDHTIIIPTRQQKEAARAKIQSMGIPLHDLDNFLFTAIAMGDTDIVKLVIEAGANINAKDGTDATPLMRATCLGRIQIVRQLLSYGANVNMRPHNCPSVLDNAIMKNYGAIAKLLIDAGADVNTPYESVTPLLLAAIGKQYAVCEHLLQAGANVNFKGPDGKNALACVLSSPNDQQEALVNLFIKAGVDVNVRFTVDNRFSNCTPLMLGVISKNPRIVKALLQAGARVNEVNSVGTSALLIAESFPYSANTNQIIQLLRAAGARN